MPVTLTTHAVEESTYVITVAFTDEDGSTVVPNAITWTLTDPIGNVINNLEDISISPPDSSVTITLKGDDLSLAVGEVGLGQRVLTIEATYDSSLGSNLPLKDTAHFNVLDIKTVT